MNASERTVVFSCTGDDMIGILHLPDEPRKTGFIAVAAGGIQYRAGCSRQLVLLTRKLSSQGFACLRFDHRGMGDSDGERPGFENLEPDIGAAIAAFREQVPDIEQVVLYGGCEAASGIMIGASRHPDVVGMVLGNPWASTEETSKQAQRRHYYRRILEPGFWKKLVSLQYNPLVYMRDYVASKTKHKPAALDTVVEGRVKNGQASHSGPVFTEKMRAGLEDFQGKILFLLSGNSLHSDEFVALSNSSKAWEKAFSKPGFSVSRIENADQAFSTMGARELVQKETLSWLLATDSVSA